MKKKGKSKQEKRGLVNFVSSFKYDRHFMTWEMGISMKFVQWNVKCVGGSKKILAITGASLIG